MASSSTRTAVAVVVVAGGGGAVGLETPATTIAGSAAGVVGAGAPPECLVCRRHFSENISVDQKYFRL